MEKSAHDIASDPELYNLVWVVGNKTLECNGYSRTGNTIIFSDVEPTKDHKLKLIIRYVKPDTILTQANTGA